MVDEKDLLKAKVKRKKVSGDGLELGKLTLVQHLDGATDISLEEVRTLLLKKQATSNAFLFLRHQGSAKERSKFDVYRLALS